MPNTLEHSSPEIIKWVPTCVLCGKSVKLETCKTDEYGKCIHEQSYVRKIRLEQASERVWHSHLSLDNNPRGFAPSGVLKF